jgi:hypothetical protein
MNTRKLYLVFALILGVLPATAQWNLQEDHRLTVDGNFLGFEAQTNKDGITFVAFWKSVKEEPARQGNRYSDNTDFAYYLQIVNKAGNNLLPDGGLLISLEPTRSALFGDDRAIFVDSDGNALVIVKDERNWPSGYPNQSYFVYKISSEGELLWGETPLDLDRGTAYFLPVNIKVIELSDGSYIFAREITPSQLDEGYTYIAIDRVSKNGDFIWEEPLLLEDAGVTHRYPFLANAGSDEFIIAYSKGAGFAMYAQKINSAKEKLWETSIYTGGFTSGHFPHTAFTVIPDTEGGIFAGWFDDRNSTDYENAYVSHILASGEEGFVTNDEQGLRLSLNPNMRAFKPTLHYDSAGEILYAAFEEHTYNQAWRSTVLQKVSKEGELSWNNPLLEGDDVNGLALAGVSGSHSLQSAGEGKLAFFHGYSLSLFDVSGAQPRYAWPAQQFAYTETSTKSGLQVLPLVDNEYFLSFWTDYRTGSPAAPTPVGAAFVQKVTLPSIGSDRASLAFGNVAQGETKTAEKITVTLRNHLSLLSGEGVFSLARAAEYAAGRDSIFKIVSVLEAATSAEPQVAEVILSFTPPGVQEYTDTLIVRTDYAEEYRIPLSGTGLNPTGIERVAETRHASPLLLSRNGDIIISGASAGSQISVYNLHGQLIKTQTATSEVEILKTASFPRGVYIVTLRNDRQEILKRKVVL